MRLSRPRTRSASDRAWTGSARSAWRARGPPPGGAAAGGGRPALAGVGGGGVEGQVAAAGEGGHGVVGRLPGGPELDGDRGPLGGELLGPGGPEPPGAAPGPPPH